MSFSFFKKYNLIFAFFLINIFFSFILFSESKNSNLDDDINVSADSMNFHKKTNTIVCKGKVEITYQDILLTADSANVNTKTGDIHANGNIKYKRNDETWSGDSLTGNIRTKNFSFDSYMATKLPWYIKGKAAKGKKDDFLEIEHASFSTCEYLLKDDPDYSFSATSIKIYKDGHFLAKNCILKVANVPLFYLPFIRGGAGEDNAFNIEMGQKSNWGGFVSLARKYKINKNIDTKFNADYRTSRGLGLGNETKIKTDKSLTLLNLYGMRDNKPTETEPGFDKRFKTQKNRYRTKLYHKSDLSEKLTLTLNADKLSDITILEDLYEKEYNENPQSASFADLTWLDENFELSLNSRFRVNDFYTTVERKPELSLNIPRIKLWSSSFYYSSDTSIANLAMRWRSVDKQRLGNIEDLHNYDSLRFDTTHSLYRPFKFENGLNFLPRVSLNVTHYSNSSSSIVSVDDLNNMLSVANPDNVDGTEIIANSYDSKAGSLTRLTFELGFEVSQKYFKTISDYKNLKWGYDGIRHVVQPYLNYTSLFNPSKDKENIYFFDEKDRLDSNHFLRLGLKQRFQTRRKNKIYTFASVENYADVRIVTRDTQKYAGDFGTFAQFKPNDEFSIWTQLLIDMGESSFKEGALGFSYGDKNAFNLNLSYLFRNAYISNPVYSLGSTLSDYSSNNLFEQSYDKSHSLDLTFGIPITEKTYLTVSYVYDIIRKRLASQTYEFRRDMHCLAGSVKLREYEGVYEVMFLLYIKALPSLKVGI